MAWLLFLVGPTAWAEDSTDSAAANRVLEEQLLEEAQEITELVTRMRGLELKADIKKGVKERDELRALLIEKIAEEVTDLEIENEAKIYKRLGLIPEDMSYKQMMLDLLTEEIAGFYDQSAKELYIMEGTPFELQRPAVAHELFHAIQDQHFDIGRMLAPFTSQENGDFTLARMALIEGDATVVMIDYTLYEGGVLPQDRATSIVDIPFMAAMLMELDVSNMAALEQMMPATGDPDSGMPSLDDTAIGRAPLIIQHMLLFPYFGGMKFVIMARNGNTWKDVDAIYANPPVSTSQIMHPELYFANHQPFHVDYDVSGVLGDDYSPIYETVLGELQMLLWLKTHLDVLGSDGLPVAGDVDTASAAKGWGGDRFKGFEDAKGNVVATHLSNWDSVDDAREYFEAQRVILAHRYPQAKATHKRGKHGQAICMQRSQGDKSERIYLEQWGDLVLYIEGTPSLLDAQGQETDTTTFDLRDRIWKTTKRTPFQEVLRERVREIDAQESQKAAEEAQ